MQTEGILFGEMIPNEYRYTVLGAVFVTFAPLIAVGPGLGKIHWIALKMSTHRILLYS
jgi:hypothetical protein